MPVIDFAHIILGFVVTATCYATYWSYKDLDKNI